MTPLPLPKLQRYVLLERLGESMQATVYKAYPRNRPDDLVILKLLKTLASGDSQLAYLQQKVERLKVLHDARVCTPLSIEAGSAGLFVVQPWFAGIPADVWAGTRARIALEDFFTFAIFLTDILQSVHDAGITHGGVKPHNILVQPGTLTLRLIDFITPLDIRDVSHFIYDPEFVRGTLAYTSPEQTGRINYRVDFSTDLYSLGIVLYELLTGTLPFFSSDPLELIHCQLAEEAPMAHLANAEVPPQLGSIIAKLLIKQPEKRYQSAAGLLADLLRCRDDYASTGQVTTFPVGTRDRTRRVVFISKMVGRQAESQLIHREYDAVIGGSFRAVFISGWSGIGKTRLIQELQKPLVRDRGYFASGKFDQYQKNIPYSSLIQALRGLMRVLLTEDDSRVAQWKVRILDAVGRDARVIADVVPELEFIVGPQPEVAHLPPVEARNRFNNLFGRFLACLASQDNPLVLFIDDLQWCDSATFDFLQTVFDNHREHPHLLLLGAYRHNEVGPDHPLQRMIRATLEREGPLQEVRLESLDEQDCHEMVAYILDSALESTVNLASFIARLTEGNPLFVSEMLAWLFNEGLLNMDDQRQWHWDMNRISNTRMPENVVELFSSKVHKLPVSAQRILTYCACMGNRFTQLDIIRILDIPLENLFEDLKPVLSLGLLLENRTELQFVHDRVQEAVLRQVDERSRTALHWRIGNQLLTAVPVQADLEALDNLFTIAAHLNKGRPAEVDEETAYRLVDINFHGGNKALDALAGEAANQFYRLARENLPGDCWTSAYERTFRIYQRLAKTELMCGHYDTSERLIDQLIEHAVTDIDKAEALAEQTTSLSSFGNFIKAIETANRGLAFFDKAIPDDAASARRLMEKAMRRIDALGDVWDTILHMPFTRERQSKIELAIYSELIPDLYMSGLVPQLYLSAAQSTLHSLEGGMDESVIYSFSIMGLNLGEQGQFEQAFRYEDLAHDLCARHPNTFGATRGMNGIVWCNMHTRSHPAEIVDYAQKGIQCGKNCGDLYNAGLSYGPLMWNLAVQGKNLRLVEEAADECILFSQKNQLSFSIGLAKAVQAGWIAPMKPGYQPVPMDDVLHHWEMENYVAASGSYFALLSFAHYFLGNHSEAGEALTAVERFLHGLTDNVLKRLWYVFRILNRLRFTEDRTWSQIQAEIEPWLAKIETWARLGPLLRPYLMFIHAEIARCKGEVREARSLFLDAIAEAQMQDYVLLAGHLHECLADLIAEASLGNAEIFYGEARRLYRLSRADGKSRLLQERHPYTPTERSLRGPQAGSASAPETGKPSATLPNLDINYLMKSTLALSEEMNHAQLLRKIMKVVMESSGAQHGYLLIKTQDQLMVVAEHHAGAKGTELIQPYGLDDAPNICRAVVNFSFRTQEKVVLGNASEEGDFRNAPEIQALGLRSVLCLPVIRKTETVGVLYLENRLSEDVFTPQKAGMTDLLTSHAAIALENARLMAETRDAYTQLRQNQEHMLQMEKLSALGTLVGGVAHEINNPLMGIMNFVEYAAEKCSDETIRTVLEHARHEVERIKKIVSNMLIFVRTRSAQNGSCRVGDVIEHTRLLLDGDLKKAGIEVRIDMPDDLPSVVCSPDSLQQVLINLMLNARDALADRVKPRIDLRVEAGHGWVELSISDNGPGIPEGIQSMIFDPFFTTKAPGKGTGLGLSVTRRIIEDAGGTIEAMNISGDKGCCMRLHFKVSDEIGWSRES